MLDRLRRSASSSALTSVGSGALDRPRRSSSSSASRPHRVVGTDVFHAAALLWVAGIAHWIGGNVDFGLMGTILIGSMPGVWIGDLARCRACPRRGLRPALGCVLLGSALGVFTKAGVDVPVGVIVGAPLARAAPCAWLVAPRSARRAAGSARGGARRERALRAHPARGPRGRGDPHHARGRRRARAPGAAVLRRQGLDRPAAPGREGVPARRASRSRSCTSTPATTSPRSSSSATAASPSSASG